MSTQAQLNKGLARTGQTIGNYSCGHIDLPQIVGNGVEFVHVLFLAHGEGLLPQMGPHNIQGNQHLAWYVAPYYGQICTPCMMPVREDMVDHIQNYAELAWSGLYTKMCHW